MMDAALLLIIDRLSELAGRLAAPPPLDERLRYEWLADGRDPLGPCRYVEAPPPDWLWKYLPSELQAGECRCLQFAGTSMNRMLSEALRSRAGEHEYEDEHIAKIFPWLAALLDAESRWCLALLWQSENAELKQSMLATEAVGLLESELANATPRRGFVAFHVDPFRSIA
jgi:hypothetical protein